MCLQAEDIRVATASGRQRGRGQNLPPALGFRLWPSEPRENTSPLRHATRVSCSVTAAPGREHLPGRSTLHAAVHLSPPRPRPAGETCTCGLRMYPDLSFPRAEPGAGYTPATTERKNREPVGREAERRRRPHGRGSGGEDTAGIPSHARRCRHTEASSRKGSRWKGRGRQEWSVRTGDEN